MATNAFIGQGATLEYDSGGGTFVAVAEVQNFGAVKSDKPNVPAGHLSSTEEEFIAGFAVPKEVNAVCNWDPTNATHALIISDFVAGTKRSWRCRWKKGGSVIQTATFTAHVMEMGPDQTTKDGLVAFSFTLQRSGNITWS